MEYELRRLQTHLERAESRQQRWRKAVDGLDFCGSQSHAEEKLVWWNEEVERLESRLREVLQEHNDQ